VFDLLLARTEFGLSFGHCIARMLLPTRWHRYIVTSLIERVLTGAKRRKSHTITAAEQTSLSCQTKITVECPAEWIEYGVTTKRMIPRCRLKVARISIHEAVARRHRASQTIRWLRSCIRINVCW